MAASLCELTATAPLLGPYRGAAPIAVGLSAEVYGSRGTLLFEPYELNWFNDLTSH